MNQLARNQNDLFREIILYMLCSSTFQAIAYRIESMNSPQRRYNGKVKKREREKNSHATDFFIFYFVSSEACVLYLWFGYYSLQCIGVGGLMWSMLIPNWLLIVMWVCVYEHLDNLIFGYYSVWWNQFCGLNVNKFVRSFHFVRWIKVNGKFKYLF